MLASSLMSWLPSAAEGSAAHADPVAALAIGLALILLAARAGGELAIRIRQPEVLGELVAGVVLGNLVLLGFDRLDYLKTDPLIDALARLGVVVLLFAVGLESTVRQMLRVGLSAFVVACLGVIAPFGLGWFVGSVFFPQETAYAHAFLGATLAATSVGITARVLRDLDRSSSDEARIILGAAVIDDVLGLVILAAVTAVIAAADRGQAFSYSGLSWIVGKSLLFIGGSLAVGVMVSPRLFSMASRFNTRGLMLALALAFCFAFAWLADLVGLAAIVGGFSAGLVLEDAHFRAFREKGELSLEQQLEPITAFLTPVFFVVMGMRTDLHAFANPRILGLGLAITLAAIVGKQICGLGVLSSRANRLIVGIGMIPRGEVGLIFAAIGASLTIGGVPVFSRDLLSAIVMMVILTTLVTPPALKWAYARKPGAHDA